jgi:ribonuclease HII
MSMSAVIKGDSKHQEISAASIIAKVERDKHMMELDRQFPFYNFKQHKGYPTKEHIRLIREHGVSDVHRKTFKPVSDLLI